MESVAFFGDSHTHGNIGFNYLEKIAGLFPSLKIVNLGHNGDRISDLNARLKDLAPSELKKVVILIGSNDVFAIQSGQETLEEFKLQYQALLDGILGMAKTQVLVISIPWVGDVTDDPINKIVQSCNAIIVELAMEKYQRRGLTYVPFAEKLAFHLKSVEGQNVPLKSYDFPQYSRAFLDFNKKTLLRKKEDDIARENGFYLTQDGLHLNRLSATILLDLLAPHIK